MKEKCELCGAKEHLIEFPTVNGSEHTFCMECAGKAAVEALRWLEMGKVREVEAILEVQK